MSDKQQLTPLGQADPPINNLPSIENKKSSKKKIALLSVLVLALIGGLVASYFLFFQQPTAKELYRESLKNSVSIQSKEAYGSFDIDSGDTKVKGEFLGDFSSGEGRLRADIDVSSVTEGVPLAMVAEMIVIEEENKSEGYTKYKSVTSSNLDYKQNIEDYFSPALNKWVKLDDDNEEEKPTSFEEDGALAAFNSIGVFAPIQSLSEADQEVFLSAVDKYDLYQVSDEIENTRFRGIEARKIRVSVKKDVFVEFEREVSEGLSDEAEFERFEATFVDQLFGKDNEFAADVYLSPKTANIIGVSFEIDLDDPIEETTFDTKLDKINTSLLIEYDRKITIEAPTGAISQSEMDALLGR